MGEAGLARVKSEFSPQRYASEIQQLYADLLR